MLIEETLYKQKEIPVILKSKVQIAVSQIHNIL